MLGSENEGIQSLQSPNNIYIYKYKCNKIDEDATNLPSSSHRIAKFTLRGMASDSRTSRNVVCACTL
jgi:hypothetical protein